MLYTPVIIVKRKECIEIFGKLILERRIIISPKLYIKRFKLRKIILR